jgi:hypothetical protein
MVCAGSEDPPAADDRRRRVANRTAVEVLMVGRSQEASMPSNTKKAYDEGLKGIGESWSSGISATS